MPYVQRTRALTTLRSVPKLERAMRRRDINASELAKLAKTSRQTISNLRRGNATRTNVDTARAIAAALRVPVAELFDVDVDDQEATA
jgi:transcriptional regulator with XRE-family HTH domain